MPPKPRKSLEKTSDFYGAGCISKSSMANHNGTIDILATMLYIRSTEI